MQTFVQALDKSKDKVTLAWNPEQGVTVSSYKLYAALVPVAGSMTLLAENISPQVAQNPTGRGMVVYGVTIEALRTALSLPSTYDFSTLVVYYTITYVNAAGAESAIGDSNIIEIPPAGITTKYMKDDPTINRHMFGFSDSLQRWVKSAGSSSGALVVDSADFYKSNITTEYTYDGTDLSTTKSYRSDMTIAGAPAKLTTYEYTGGQLTKVTVTDSTV